MKEIAVLIPCYNEALTIEKVVKDFKQELPDAKIYVYDNNSTDDTGKLAEHAGAIVRKETHQGKGNVVRTMFREIDADAYVLVDGDDTYSAKDVHKLLKPVLEDNVDMVIGDRLSSGSYYKENKRAFHGFGNNLVRDLVNRLFKGEIRDIMTGYRTFSNRFVKCFPVLSKGFEIETEMTAFSLIMRLNVEEISIEYHDRPAGSFSKLNTFKDGLKVLITLFDLYKDYRPLYFFFLLFLPFLFVGIILIINNHIAFGMILILSAVILFSTGIVLDSVKNQTIKMLEQNLNQYELLKKLSDK
jgi:glycosyltransferase involved in cell wall biosynthesis